MSNGPLNINLDMSDVKTAVPIIADGHLTRWRLEKVTAKEVENKGNSVQFEYKLVQPAPTTDDGVIHPGDFGSTFFETIQLYAKPDAKDPKWFLKKIATRVDALIGTADKGNKAGKPERPVGFDANVIAQLIGKELIAQMKVRTGDFNGNEFNKVFFPPDLEKQAVGAN